jgi:uncharacterized protein (DUF1800 family)
VTLARTRHRAATRFGLGVRSTDPSPEDPVEAVRAELRAFLGQVPQPGPLPDTPALAAQVRAAGDDRHGVYREILDAELAARIGLWHSTPAPAVERMVAFFANHFTVSRAKGPARAYVGSFEREAIRPNLGGHFEQLLLASTRHPAMVLYLDQARSVGPDSLVGARAERGLNENLAREILELHTLGVDGGYDQADVEAFARVLTGWSVDRETGGFRFDPRRHEPGPQTILDRSYLDRGEDTGVDVLRELANHPSTARHLARKLVTHFVADDPPAADVARIEQAWRSSGGHLPTVLDAVVALPSAWSGADKLRTPQDLLTAAVVALPAGAVSATEVARALERLGQAAWKAPSPAGWPDTAADWVAPDAMVTRVELAVRLASLSDALPDPHDWAHRLVGPVASPELMAALPALEARRLVALVLASPEFQRR